MSPVEPPLIVFHPLVLLLLFVAPRPSATLELGAAVATTPLATTFNLPISLTFSNVTCALYVTDSTNLILEVFYPSLALAVVAGNGANVVLSEGYNLGGSGSRDGDALFASFSVPSQVVVTSGGLLVADAGNGVLRTMSFATSEVSTLAPGKVRSNLYEFPTGVFDYPTGLAVDASGTLSYVTETSANRLSTLNLVTGVAALFAGRLQQGFVDGNSSTARFFAPGSLTLTAAGDLLCADAFNHAVRIVTPAGHVSTQAGRGVAGFADGPAAVATFGRPGAIAIAPYTGIIYVSDYDNSANRAISPRGLVTTLLAVTFPIGLAMDPGGSRSFVTSSNGVVVVAIANAVLDADAAEAAEKAASPKDLEAAVEAKIIPAWLALAATRTAMPAVSLAFARSTSALVLPSPASL